MNCPAVFPSAGAVAGALILALAFCALAPNVVPNAVAQSGGFGGVRGFRQESPEVAAKFLEDFRNYRIGQFCFKFTIKHVPRRGDETVNYDGVLWTAWAGDGPVFRIELTPPKGAKNAAGTAVAIGRFILKSGPNPRLWAADASGKPVALASGANKPFFPGLIFTPFELQTPFTYWSGAEYIRTDRFRGRPTHFFKMTPPAAFRAANPKIGHVQLGFDRQFNALMQAVVFDPNGNELRKFEAESFAKVQNVYVPEEFRVLDLVSRDKDIFRVTEAAVHIRHPDGIFNPETLGAPAPLPLPEKFGKVE